MFDRLIGIDWSGAGEDTSRLRGLRVASWTEATGPALLTSPSPRARNWNRQEILGHLATVLAPGEPRAAVAMDFAFGYPQGADNAVFGVRGWSALVKALGALYEQHGTAGATALAINDSEAFGGHGPFRFDDSRVDFRFYLDRGVAYYRLAELVVPQAISTWYAGSGAKVSFHTITGLAFLAKLLELRQEGSVDFAVWPQERASAPFEGHVLIESYPAALPPPASFGPCETPDDRDAWRMLEWMRHQNDARQLEARLTVPISALGELDPDPLERVRLEGWILGIE